MYKPPMEFSYGPLQFTSPETTAVSDFVKEQHEQLCMTAIQTVDLTIDKEELIKALNYDRQQYQQGYNDGYKAGLDEGITLTNDWISCTDLMPPANVLVFYYGEDKLGPVWGMAKWNPLKDKWMLTVGSIDKSIVTHWMYRTTPKDKE